VHLGTNWVFWLSIIGTGAAFGGIALLLQRLFYKDIRIAELGAGTTKLSLSKESGTYFDEYLDEIVYYFQKSKTSVVIFEDLDRFKDPHIFETLRELNILLNNADQIRQRPIKFVYAIRDSIFEQLDVEADLDDEDVPLGPKTADRDALRLTTTNRTKFFDLVVPMVPFISHRTSRDLIEQELQAVPEAQRPSRDIIDVVGAYLTDMRLIKNICNEYEVFRRRILAADGLKELTPDGLFAMMVYKNQWMADYEAVREGTSKLDAIYRAYRTWVAQQTALGRKQTTDAQAALRRVAEIGPRGESHGERLQVVLRALYTNNVSEAEVDIIAGQRTFRWDDLRTPQFWQVYAGTTGNLTINYRRQYVGHQHSYGGDRIEKLMGESISLDDWTEADRTELQEQAKAGRAAQEFAIRASMKRALAAPSKRFTYEGVNQSLLAYAREQLDGADLAYTMLEGGYIDENFTLYVTEFPGGIVSPSAMNFIIKAVQQGVADIEYQFARLPEDIEAVLGAEERRLLGSDSVYNIQIFDHLLASDSPKLDGPFSALNVDPTMGTEFMDAYLASGKYKGKFVRRLSALWPDIFVYLREHRGESDDENLERLSDALMGARPELSYRIEDADRTLIESEYLRLAAVTEEKTEDASSEIAKTLAQLRVKLPDLSKVARSLLIEAAPLNLYRLTVSNLRAVLGADAQLSLDAIKAARPNDVYRYVLTRLDVYLAAASESGVPTVRQQSAFVAILEDVADVHPDAVESVASSAAPDCAVQELTELDAALWPALARAHRFTLTDVNVTAYVKEHGVDEALSGHLEVGGSIAVTDEDTSRLRLGTELLNAPALSVATTKSALASLRLDSGSIDPATITKPGRPLIPWLVHEELVEDTAAAFASVAECDWAVKEELIRSSSAFVTYLPSLTLASNDLRDIATKAVSDEVKNALLDNIDVFREQLGANGAVGLASWAAAKGLVVPAATLLLLASKGGRTNPQIFVKLASLGATTLDLGQLVAVLNLLGDPYSRLTSPGKDRPKVPTADGLAAVLARLQREGSVSKFQENIRKGFYDVSKRHS
jgi:hypothetical protein